jgi:hypothetical protein
MDNGHIDSNTPLTPYESELTDKILRDFRALNSETEFDPRFLPLAKLVVGADEFEVDFKSLNLFVGLDSGKFTEGQRNQILIELERMGADTGLQVQVLNPQDRQGRIAITLKGDAKKDQAKHDLWIRFLELMERYDALYRQALEMLLAMIGAIDDRIAVLDNAIDEQKRALAESGDSESDDAYLQQLEAERAELERIKEEELEAEQQALSSENRAPSLDRLTSIYEDIATTMSSYTNNNSANDNANNSTSAERLRQLQAQYARNRSRQNDDEDETEAPRPPQL